MNDAIDYCIRLKNLGKRFTDRQKSVQAFTDITLDIPRGQFVCLVGPSGCGKTTLLRCLAGIETPSSGSFSIDVEKRPNTSRLAMVFQQHGLFPWMTLEENLRIALRNSPLDPQMHGDILNHLLEKVGLQVYRRFYPYQLSGGMNQRVSLVRAFCVYPQVLLMDEPFVFLDYQNRMILQDLLLKLWGEQHQTIFFVTHNINEAIALGDRILLMTASPGRIKNEIVSDFPRPRDVTALRRDPVYAQMVVDITNRMKDEIIQAQKVMEQEWLSRLNSKKKA